VVLLDGIVFGVLTAIVATALYALLFMAREDALSLSVLTPAAAMIGAAVVAAVIRAIAQAQRRRNVPIFEASSYPPMLESSPLVSPQYEEVMRAIEQLRGELRDSLAQATAPREPAPAAFAGIEMFQDALRVRAETIERAHAEAKESLEGRLRAAEETLRVAHTPVAPAADFTLERAHLEERARK